MSSDTCNCPTYPCKHSHPVTGEFDPALKAGLDHPCRETCSGWKQGRDRGLYDSQSRIVELEARYLGAMKIYKLACEGRRAFRNSFREVREENNRLKKAIDEAMENLRNVHDSHVAIEIFEKALGIREG